MVINTISTVLQSMGLLVTFVRRETHTAVAVSPQV